ncbi:hypothetical protein [Microbacterium capsulatum]|uniref:Type VII secretion integral membrane protein EccD n=1 Tax=Microbacterium capsulatum TaxID=3041921 RepID=A0ABU0XJH8_9MICO|nr:hypothetical protein [Microbacterium sp. ASV81]MDQ4215256.1 hypothetical protein [Microbacterium sp. ASV81]
MVSGGVIERRRIALAGERARVDLALPFDETLADVLRTSGLGEISVPGGRLAVLDPLGYEVDAATLGEELVEGGLYTVVDLPARTAEPEQRRRGGHGPDRVDHGSRWLLLVVCAVLLLAAVTGTTLLDTWIRFATALLAAAGAAVTAVVWTRTERAAGALALRGVFAPAALSFAAGALLIPASLGGTALPGAVQLSTAAGLLAAAITTALIALLTARRIRAAAGTIAILLVAFGAVWGFALLVHWGAPASAAICLGLVPLLLRGLPSALVNLPEGSFIDYEHFMSSRWTVRGTIPEPVTEVRPESVRRVVDESSARLTAGTVLLAAAAAVFAPIALLGEWGEDPFVVSGGIALTACVVLALLLIPRHTSARVLRWSPRAAAVVVLLVAVAAFATGPAGRGLFGGALPSSVVLPLAAVLFVAAVVAVALTRPVSRGAGSLAWSRVGDVVEALAVALALPAALLHADVLTLLRGLVAT